MKRTVSLRRSPLRSTATLRTRQGSRTPDPARALWKAPRWGRCENCGELSDRPLHGHHVIERQTVARAGGDEWDLRNRMDLCEGCHGGHHFGQENRKISVDRVPGCAFVFGVELLGRHLAAEYFARRYRMPTESELAA